MSRAVFSADQVRVIKIILTDKSVKYDVEFIDSHADASMIVPCGEEDEARDILKVCEWSCLLEELDEVEEEH